jgi:hypothetical protein
MCTNQREIKEFISVHFPHLRPAFVQFLNDEIGWLKRQKSGNGQMTIKFSGGIDHGTQWVVNDPPPKDA